MLKLAACIEEHFPHSMAKAIVRAAKDHALPHKEMHSDVEYVVAHGIASVSYTHLDVYKRQVLALPLVLI